MINRGSIPPLVSHRQLNPKIPALETDHRAINTTLLPWKTSFRAICVNSYGAAGSNSAMLICQDPQMPKIQKKERHKYLTYPIIICAQSKESLQRYVELLNQRFRRSASTFDIGDLAFSLSRRHLNHRFRFNHYTGEVGRFDIRSRLRRGKDRRGSPRCQARRSCLLWSGQTSFRN